MTQKAYIKQILEPHVKPLIEEGKDIVLFEDSDSNYSPSKNNPERAWKEEHNLKHCFNVSSSLDLNIIENCQQAPKQHVNKYPHWSDEETGALIIEGWANVKHETINKMVKTNPNRFKDVIKTRG